MIAQSYTQKATALSLLVSLCLLCAQSVHATSIAICVPFTFSESYTVNSQTLPAQVEVGTYTDGWQYVTNRGSKTLTFHDALNTNKLDETLILVSEKAVVTFGGAAGQTYTYTDAAALGAGRLSELVHFHIPRTNHDSNIRPAQPEATAFSIPAVYDGNPITITGTLSYSLIEHDCTTGKVTTTAPSMAPAHALVAFSFGQNLSFGMKVAAVSSLQQFLASQGLLSADLVTGYFGPKTLAAVKAFQSQQGIAPVSGFFGPLTRAKANAVANGTVY